MHLSQIYLQWLPYCFISPYFSTHVEGHIVLATLTFLQEVMDSSPSTLTTAFILASVSSVLASRLPYSYPNCTVHAFLNREPAGKKECLILNLPATISLQINLPQPLSFPPMWFHNMSLKVNMYLWGISLAGVQVRDFKQISGRQGKS